MQHALEATEIFIKWQAKLKDRQAARAIAGRLVRATEGNLGDIEPVGGGVSEMRIFAGKGYRVYFVIRGSRLILLLNGGDKSSQQRDIRRARQILKELED